jgi:hypothetical protein
MEAKDEAGSEIPLDAFVGAIKVIYCKDAFTTSSQGHYFVYNDVFYRRFDLNRDSDDCILEDSCAGRQVCL